MSTAEKFMSINGKKRQSMFLSGNLLGAAELFSSLGRLGLAFGGGFQLVSKLVAIGGSNHKLFE